MRPPLRLPGAASPCPSRLADTAAALTTEALLERTTEVAMGDLFSIFPRPTSRSCPRVRVGEEGTGPICPAQAHNHDDQVVASSSVSDQSAKKRSVGDAGDRRPKSSRYNTASETSGGANRWTETGDLTLVTAPFGRPCDRPSSVQVSLGRDSGSAVDRVQVIDGAEVGLAQALNANSFTEGSGGSHKCGVPKVPSATFAFVSNRPDTPPSRVG